jgi:hypothetical protein
MTGSIPAVGRGSQAFVTDDEDAVTGDYANPLENRPVSIIFVIVTWSPIMGQVAHD